eukprot:GHVQ01025338.1.p1 GENE.GHVQ01025338.1~~GHVQ01025338.1.p1  ORF type:complete len:311 (-),score=24.04 GHVQ01025338.1:23-955(-)
MPNGKCSDTSRHAVDSRYYKDAFVTGAETSLSDKCPPDDSAEASRVRADQLVGNFGTGEKIIYYNPDCLDLCLSVAGLEGTGEVLSMSGNHAQTINKRTGRLCHIFISNEFPIYLRSLARVRGHNCSTDKWMIGQCADRNTVQEFNSYRCQHLLSGSISTGTVVDISGQLSDVIGPKLTTTGRRTTHNQGRRTTHNQGLVTRSGQSTRGYQGTTVDSEWVDLFTFMRESGPTIHDRGFVTTPGQGTRGANYAYMLMVVGDGVFVIPLFTPHTSSSLCCSPSPYYPLVTFSSPHVFMYNCVCMGLCMSGKL